MNKKKNIIFNGHSMQLNKNSPRKSKSKIIVYDRQNPKYEPYGRIITAPSGYLDTYIAELEKRLLDNSISVEANSELTDIYGHIEFLNGWDGVRIKGNKVPVLSQETEEDIYIKNGILDIEIMEFLRRTFADSLQATIKKMQKK